MMPPPIPGMSADPSMWGPIAPSQTMMVQMQQQMQQMQMPAEMMGHGMMYHPGMDPQYCAMMGLGNPQDMSAMMGNSNDSSGMGGNQSDMAAMMGYGSQTDMNGVMMMPSDGATSRDGGPPPLPPGEAHDFQADASQGQGQMPWDMYTGMMPGMWDPNAMYAYQMSMMGMWPQMPLPGGPPSNDPHQPSEEKEA